MVNREELIAAMKTAGASRYPNEACGLIVAAGKKSVVIECENISPTPRDRFMIGTADYSKASDMGEIIGVWHTHTDEPPTPSDGDKVDCEKSEVPWFILGVSKDESGEFQYSEPVMFEPSGFEMPYLGRPYVMGVLDCYTLLLDFYKREYGIHINDYPRIEADGRLGSSLFVDRYEQEGFVRLIDKDVQIGDVFLIQVPTENTPAHIAIYIGDDQIMHHCHGRLSKRDIYGGGYWQKHTTYHLRHKTKC